MRKIFNALLLCLLCATLLASCGTVSRESAELCSHSEFVQVAPDATNGEEFLFTVDYADYDYDKALALYNSAKGVGAKSGACTAVRKGNFFGRNLDFYIRDEAQVVVRMAPKKGRYASIGMATGFSPVTKDALLDGELPEAVINQLPLATTDGINENGVVVNTNVVPRGDFGNTTGTNPGKTPVPQMFITRFVLDNAKSVDDAVEKISKLNIYATDEMPDNETHFMIADPNKTVIVEFGDNKMVVTEKNIMTNYYASKPYTPFGLGYEREARIEKVYDSIQTQGDMFKAMKSVWYSQAYSSKTAPFWYSELLDLAKGNTYDDIKAGRFDKFEEAKKKVEDEYVSIDYQKQHRGKDNTNWYTTHTTVYDIANRSFVISVQENEKLYEFSLKK